jgi:hypothetical protein
LPAQQSGKTLTSAEHFPACRAVWDWQTSNDVCHAASGHIDEYLAASVSGDG